MGIDPATLGTIATVGSAVGGLGGGGGEAKAQVPSDLVGPRADSIKLLQYLLGYGGGSGQAPRPSRGEGPLSWYQRISGGGMGGLPDLSGDPTGRLESFFGKLGVPQTDLQQSASAKLMGFLNGPAPEANALDAINKILSQNPGQGMLDALQPRFQQNLSAANAQGPRFGSANALLKEKAVDDYNLLSQQALQQGVGQQLQAAQLANLIGNSQFDRLQGAYGIGTQQANQADVETQRRLQILLNLLGVQQSATLGLPIAQQPDFFSRLGTAATNAATTYGQFNRSGGIGA